jgi:hypothetical protein
MEMGDVNEISEEHLEKVKKVRCRVGCQYPEMEKKKCSCGLGREESTKAKAESHPGDQYQLCPQSSYQNGN